MNIGEELDRLAAEGRLSSVTLARRHGGGWQCYLKLGLVDSYVAQIDETPTAALTKAIEKLPSCEAYDLKYSAEAVTDRAQQAAAPVEKGIFE